MAERALAFADDRAQGFARALCLDEAWSRLDPRAGDRETAIRELETAVHDEASAVRCRGARVRFDDARGTGDDLMGRLAEVRDAAASLGLHDEEARCSAALASRLAYAGRFDEATAEANRLLDLAEQRGLKSAALDAWQTLAIVRQTQGALSGALDARRAAAAAARSAGLKEREAMLTTNLGFALTTIGARQEARAALEAARADSRYREELGQLVEHLDDSRRDGVLDWRELGPAPLQLHARYRQDEILAALRAGGAEGVPRLQGGVYFEPASGTDVLLVTLRKSERGFSPTTMYRDYAISPSLFHWESQNSAHASTAAGARYVAGTSNVLLFVREVQEQANGVAEAYTFLGRVILESWQGERPMQIVWRLAHPMPGPLYTHATVAAG